jgi:hypothetical protein
MCQGGAIVTDEQRAVGTSPDLQIAEYRFDRAQGRTTLTQSQSAPLLKGIGFRYFDKHLKTRWIDSSVKGNIMMG